MTDTRKPIFDAVRAAGGTFPSQTAVDLLDNVLTRLGVPKVGMRISERGLQVIKDAEGCKLVAYRDTGGVLTVGYGHTGPDVKPGLTITAERATELLREDVAKAESTVARLFNEPTQGQFDALVSFAYNFGEGQVRTSTLRRLHNEGDYAGAADQFAQWNKDNGVVLPGLVKRRAAEAAEYRS